MGRPPFPSLLQRTSSAMIYQPGLLVGPLSGKAGSTTAGSSRAGNTLYVSNLTSSKGHPKQLAAAAQLTSIAALWKQLDAGQVDAWNTFGETIVTSRRFGITQFDTGYQAFQRFNGTLKAAQFPLISDPPASSPPAAVIVSSFVATSPTPGPAAATLTFTPSPLGAAEKLLIYAYPYLSAGVRSLPRVTRRLAVVTTVAVASPLDIAAELITLQGNWSPNAQLALRLVVVNDAGYRSAFFDTTAYSS